MYNLGVISDFSLFSALDLALRQARIWFFGECFCTHAFSKSCKHADGVVILAPSCDVVAIHGIPVPPRPDFSRVPLTGVESICFDINLLGRVFLKKLCMFKRIPPRLRLGFAKIFRSALDNVLVCPRDLSAWVQLLILPCCALSTFVPTNRAQPRSSERYRCQYECISHAILRWRDPVERLGLVVDRLAEATSSFSGAKKSKDFDEANVLTSSGVAPSTLDMLHELEAKHLFAPPPTLSSSPLGGDVLSVHKDLVMNRIRNFPKRTSCGRDSLKAQQLMDILGRAASPICPSQLGEFIASAPLTPLVKPDGGLRPIAVGTVWRGLVSKVASSLIQARGNEVELSMLLVDFKNAFNLVDRSILLQETRARCPSIAPWVEFCYSRPARLYYEDSIFWSCQEVQQGDPLAWYLDDGTIVGDTLMVAKALDIIKSNGPNRGLFLNVDKTELFWPVNDPRGRVEGVFPINISRPLNGVKLLGGSVSLDAGLCQDLALKKFDNALRASLEKIVTASRPGFGDWQWQLATLLIHLGGLGIHSA
ncbi:hypothetical protein Tco_0145649 [Tanacetum coccineum]